MTKIPATVRAEAMRLARKLVKELIVIKGGQVSDYYAKDISEAARQCLTHAPEGKRLIEEAARNVEKAKANPTKIN